MKVDVLNLEGKKLRKVELPEKIFAAPVNEALMHQAFVRQLANARLGTHKTKGRSEVSGGGRKPWRQKGTGRARQGSTRAAQWVGGGKIHTPKPRDYALKMPRKMRHAALRSALSVKAAAQGVVLVDELHAEEARTRLMAEAMNRLVGESSVLVLVPEKDENYERFVRSVNNLPDTKALLASYLNIRDLLQYDKLLLPLKSLDALVAILG
ncbi:MAG: 50S ribosomal protein L4 [Anaerolineales bacterium]|nr:50S ribosomal protein L4 [Anaerolineales bacterium]